MESLQERLSGLILNSPKNFQNLSVVSLAPTAPSKADLDYLLLDDGISQGTVRITELNASGSVPEVRVENLAAVPVLLVDGEELVGAKQNRVVNLTILVPARSTITIPVSCVEASRWHMASPDFQVAGHLMYAQGRAERFCQVSRSMRASGSHSSDQAAVWRNIEAKAHRLGTQSHTQAHSGLFERNAASVEGYVRAFNWQSGQTGAAFLIAGQLVGVDIFDHAEVMRRFFHKLVRSYALDALDSSAAISATSTQASEHAVANFLARIGQAQSFSNQATGLGKDIRFSGPGISGGALWALGRHIHVCAFARPGEDCETSSLWTRISRPSHRRLF
jgi:hypothetical protein